MPVMTINTDDFLVQKDSGDVVTGADWNKLVALFHAVNDNANQLLNTMKAVDVNTANIAQVTQGAVPDGSIGYDKLEKLGNIKNVYTLTTDLEPRPEVTYFTLEGDTYTAHTGLIGFTPGVQYYTLEARATRAAIADSDVIGDGVIEHFNCAPTFLGALLNDNITIHPRIHITNKLDNEEYLGADLVNASTVTVSQTHTVPIANPHKGLILISTYFIAFLTSDPDKPNIMLKANYGYTSTSGFEGVPGMRIVSCTGADQKPSYNYGALIVPMSNAYQSGVKEIRISTLHYNPTAGELQFTVYTNMLNYGHDIQTYEIDILPIGIC